MQSGEKNLPLSEKNVLIVQFICSKITGFGSVQSISKAIKLIDNLLNVKLNCYISVRDSGNKSSDIIPDQTDNILLNSNELLCMSYLT